jgi:hypothetical protein
MVLRLSRGLFLRNNDMEVVSKGMTSKMNGVVVRQFMPTRIEREVLAHVFALVCGRRNKIGICCEDDVSVPSMREDDQRAETVVGGRRAS